MNTKQELMDYLAAPENLLTAWRSVRANIPSYRRQRSAGPDGVTLAEFERELPAQLNSLRHQLLKGRYQPQMPGLFTIPKKSGGTRQLAVLNVADRVAQRAAQQVIEPLFEPAFLPCSFGFRPGRSTQDALYCARRLRANGYRWTVDGDIDACFDHLNHDVLVQRLSRRISDRRVLELLQKWLRVGLMEYGQPLNKSDWISQEWQKASKLVHRGMNWTFGETKPLLFSGLNGDDETGLEDMVYPSPGGYLDEGETEGEDDGFRSISQFDHTPVQRKAIQRLATSGLVLGAGWLKHGLRKVGPAALAAIRTPLRPTMLKQGLVLGGGVLGAAVGVALAGYLVYHRVASDAAGVLQGSPLSPLLANIYLHPFDLNLTKSGFRLVRFADDWVILCPDQTEAERAYNHAVIALDRIGLKPNLQKTRILTPDDRLEWLGESIL